VTNSQADGLQLTLLGTQLQTTALSTRPIGMIIDGGNGGLSLRDWGEPVKSLERFSTRFWPGGEDGYFAFHMGLIGGRIGHCNECAKFSTIETIKLGSPNISGRLRK